MYEFEFLVCVGTVSSKILHVVTPSASVVSSHPSTSKGGAEPSASAGLAQVDADEDVVTFGSRNLSSTLQKLYLWEKKLYNEVKVCGPVFISVQKFESVYAFLKILLFCYAPVCFLDNTTK